MFAEKVDSEFTEFREKCKVGGRLLRKFPEEIGLCKIGCIFFSGFNGYKPLTIKLGMTPSNSVQCIKLNIDIVGEKRKVEKTAGGVGEEENRERKRGESS